MILIYPDLLNKMQFPFINKRKEKKEQIIPKSKDIAALNPRKSEFGAPVVFAEDADFPKQEPDISPLPEIKKPPTKSLTQQTSPVIPQPKPPVAKPKPIEQKKVIQKKEEPSKALQKNLLAMLKKQKDQKKIKKAEKPVQKEKPKPEPKEKEPPKQIKPKIKQPTPKLPAPRKVTQRSKGFKKKMSAPAKKKNLTFADLANGFLDTLKGDGQDWEKREGNKNIRPDIQEMKFLSYARKVAWYIQNSWKLYMRELDGSGPATADISFILSIDQDGNLIDMQITQYTGYYELDAVIIKAVKKAAPFPPLPKHFKTSVLRFPSHWKYVREQVPGYRIG